MKADKSFLGVGPFQLLHSVGTLHPLQSLYSFSLPAPEDTKKTFPSRALQKEYIFGKTKSFPLSRRLVLVHLRYCVNLETLYLAKLLASLPI